MGYIDTFYGRTRTDDAPFSVLAGTVECDTCIVGGGLAGLTVALQLARSGQSVAVLEAERISWGASGRNGGFVFPGYANGYSAIERAVGADNARALHALSIEGMEFVRETIRGLNIASAAPVHGIMRVSRHEDGAELKAQADQLQREFDYPIEYLGRDQVQDLLHSKRYFQALRDPRAFHMHPLNYLRAVGREIERLGGNVFEMSGVLSGVFNGPEKSLLTAGGRIRARDVVVATGGYTAGLIPKLKRAYLPIATYVMLSEPRPDLVSAAVTTTDAVLDSRRAGDYYRVVDGGRRLLWGGRITTRAASPAALAAQLRREMTNTFPQLIDLRTEVSWSGLMSYARHLMPQIGRMQAGSGTARRSVVMVSIRRRSAASLSPRPSSDSPSATSCSTLLASSGPAAL